MDAERIFLFFLFFATKTEIKMYNICNHSLYAVQADKKELSCGIISGENEARGDKFRSDENRRG